MLEGSQVPNEYFCCCCSCCFVILRYLPLCLLFVVFLQATFNHINTFTTRHQADSLNVLRFVSRKSFFFFFFVPISNCRSFGVKFHKHFTPEFSGVRTKNFRRPNSRASYPLNGTSFRLRELRTGPFSGGGSQLLLKSKRVDVR